MRKEYPYIIIISFILGCILTYFYYRKTETLPYNEKAIQRQIDSLHKQNDSLNKRINFYITKVDSFHKQMDSLEALKNKIKYIYVKKKNEIDSSSANTVISEFSDIFSKSGIK